MIASARAFLAACLVAAAGAACAQQPAPRIFTAVRHDAAGTHPAGRVRLDGTSHLTVLAATGDGTWLRALVTRTNAVETEHLDAVPPAGAPRYADVSTPIPRSDPRYEAAMRRDLLQYYGLELVPVS